jgi:phage-related protein
MVQRAPLKKIEWIRSSRHSLKAFTNEAPYQAGSELLRVQQGKHPSDWRPMPGFGAGAIEIRIHVPFEHRIGYVAKFKEAIYVLHCFEKRTQKTRKRDIEYARSAYAEMERYREG